MPRKTAKTKKNIIKENINVKKEKLNVKAELNVACQEVVEQVSHRKSERRRIARDIFLVFEEPITRRKACRAGVSKKKQTNGKSKFGHLKVEEPNKVRATKNLLQDVKNKQNYLKDNSCATSKNKKNEVCFTKTETANALTSISKPDSELRAFSKSAKSVNTRSDISKKISYRHEHFIENAPLIARVNPIFLWVKEDNTRIVEVRCEDYDKRNRIRIQKTPKGWRAIPRSDPSSSKVFKFYSTPLMKLKRENCTVEIQKQSHLKLNIESCQNIQTQKINKSEEKINNISINITAENSKQDTNVNKKSKAKKSRTGKKKSKLKITSQIPMISVNKCEEIIRDDNFNSDNVSNKGYNDNILDNCYLQLDFSKKEIITKCSSGIKNDAYDLNCREIQPSQEDTTLDVEKNGNLVLCPKTGLFVPTNGSDINSYLNAHDSTEFIENRFNKTCIFQPLSINNNNIENVKKAMPNSKNITIDENNESLDAKTRNLKDLLDNADLLHHCDENANSNAELIDTLVKTTCENNLIADNDNHLKDALQNLPCNQKTMSINEKLSGIEGIVSNVSDTPKCLSFNEAGEIEGPNGELFHSASYIETFEKQPTSSTVLENSDILELQNQPTAVPHTIPDDIINIDINECSKSNQMLHSPQKQTEDLPKDLSYKKREEVCPQSESRSQCAVSSSSDIIKSPQQSSASALSSSSETLKNLILEQFIKLNTLTSHQNSELSNINPNQTNSNENLNFIETVVIDDTDNDGDDEPKQKRNRKSSSSLSNKMERNYSKSKINIDGKDPDALTQLRMLIRNPQWKVPDPILVPKDRLSAVLASPAREIPLLITTRPELRLPEAFAFPEIIQNPNILVISMAQLETILKNEIEVNNTCSESLLPLNYPTLNTCSSDILPKLTKLNETSNLKNTIQSSLKKNHINVMESNVEEVVCSHRDDATSLLSSDVNTAAMNVINQMLWLPYLAQFSQDFISQNCESFLQLQNTSSQTNLEAHKSPNNKVKFCNNSDKKKTSPSSNEINIFQKVLHHQIKNIMNLNKEKTNETIEKGGENWSTKSIEKISPLKNVEPGIKSKLCSLDKKYIINTNVPEMNKNKYEKTYNLRSSTSCRQNIDSTLSSASHNSDHKPRLTCKSLSNLLDPGHCLNKKSSIINSGHSTSKSAIKESGFLRGTNQTSSYEKPTNFTQPRNSLISGPVVETGLNNCGQNNSSVENSLSDNITRNNDLNTVLTPEVNTQLWHPLFGSNAKPMHSSPWQWTTVTATSE